MAHQVDYGPFSPLENYPCNRGFEEHWGVIWGVVNYFDPFSLVHSEEPIKEVSDDFYMTGFITQKSIDLIDDYSKDDKPFFLYVAHTAPHWPLHALPEDIEKYKDTYLETINGEKAVPPVGKNLLPLLFNQTETIHDTLYWEHEGGRTIRIGDWKMSALPEHKWELFNLAADHTETNDLSSEFPVKVAEMNKVWENWAYTIGVR